MLLESTSVKAAREMLVKLTPDLFWSIPVKIQIQTTVIAMPTLRSSAEVNRPQKPNDIFVVFRQGLKCKKLVYSRWRPSAHLKLSQLIWQQQNFISKQMIQSLNFFSCKLLDGVSCVPVYIRENVRKNIRWKSKVELLASCEYPR